MLSQGLPGPAQPDLHLWITGQELSKAQTTRKPCLRSTRALGTPRRGASWGSGWTAQGLKHHLPLGKLNQKKMPRKGSSSLGGGENRKDELDAGREMTNWSVLSSPPTLYFSYWKRILSPYWSPFQTSTRCTKSSNENLPSGLTFPDSHEHMNMQIPSTIFRSTWIKNGHI